MPFFPCAHAGGPHWAYTVRQVTMQLRAQVGMQQLDGVPCLGLAYVSAPFAAHAAEIVQMLATDVPEVQHWVGSSAHTVLAGDMDYGATGALAVMLVYLQPQDYAVFSGMGTWDALPATARVALVHGDAASAQLSQQIQQLQQQMGGAGLVGGLCHMPVHTQWTWGQQAANQRMPQSIGGGGIQIGGLSGVAFAESVECVAVGMQGCKPTGAAHTISAVEDDMVLELDGKPALEVLFGDVNWAEQLLHPSRQHHAVGERVQRTLLAMTPADSYVSASGLASTSRVLRIHSVDPWRLAVRVHGAPMLGQQLVPCVYDEHTVRAEVQRACAQLWESLISMEAHATTGAEQPSTGRCIRGAVYIRNHQRRKSTPHVNVDQELQWIRHVLGPVPLLGFSSSCEIDHGAMQHLSAQLLVFTQPLPPLS